MWDFSSLFSGLGSGAAGGSASAFGGLGAGGGLGGLTGPAATSVAQQQGVGSNPFGFTQGGGADAGSAMDPKYLQQIMSMANGTAGGNRPQAPGSAGVAPRATQVQLGGVPTPAQYAPGQRLSLRNLIYGG